MLRYPGLNYSPGTESPIICRLVMKQGRNPRIWLSFEVKKEVQDTVFHA